MTDDCSGSEVGSSSVEEEPEPVNISVNLGDAAKFAFAAFTATILRLDFNEDYNKEFRTSTIDLISTHLQLPAKSSEAVHSYLDQNGANATDDIVPFITTLKSDEFLSKHGCLVLAADLISEFVRTGCYDARYRILLRHICALLALSWDEVEECEQSVVHLLEEKPYEENEDDQAKRKKRDRNKKIKRYLMIGAGGAVGGVLIGLTGGLAAPIFAAGVGMIAGTAAATGIATTAGAAILGSLFGVAGAGLSGYKMKRRVGAIEEFAVETLSNGRSLHIAVAVSGWISEEREDSFRFAWRHLACSSEQFCLRYESQYLLQFGQGIEYLTSFAVSYAIQQTLMETALAGLMSALAWPLSILTVGTVVDNPWSVCCRRATEVGHHLSQLLLTRQQGNRPVTLIGFSMGARVIYHCLLDMSKDKNGQGIIEDVILLGAPVTGSPKEWRQVSKVVSGRIINGYSKTDWLLKFLYRTMNIQFSIAGTAAVETGCPKVVNINLSHIIQGHMDYQHKLTEVLAAVGVKVTPRSSESFVDFSGINKSMSTMSVGSDALSDKVRLERSFKSRQVYNCSICRHELGENFEVNIDQPLINALDAILKN